MKRLLPLVLISAMPALAQFSTVSCTHGETGVCRQATTCSQANVQAAVTASSAGTDGYISPTSLHGDGVYIPAGACSWSGGVGWVDKNIGIIGGVGGTTTITASGDAFEVSVTNAAGNGTTTAAAFRISNLTISGGHPLNINTSNPNMTTFAGFFRFDNVTYNTSAGGNAVIIYGPVYGVFDHLNGTASGGNHFEQAMFLGSEFPATSSLLMGETVGRMFAIGLGDQNAVYIENSTFNCAGAFGSGAISDSESGPQRMVFRDNTVTGSCNHYAHWTRDGEWDGGRIEIYNNNYTCSGSGCSGGYPGRFDAGTGVIFNNTLTGYGTTSFQIDEARGCGAQTSGVAGACAGSPPGNSQIDVNAGDTNAPGWPCAGQVGTACIAGGCARGAMNSVPFIMWNNGAQAGCSTGGSCTNSYSFNVDGPPGGNSCTRTVTNYLKSTAHSLSGSLNGAIDFFSGASKPSSVGIYTAIASYTPLTFPYPTTASKTLTKMVVLPPSTGYWIFSAANTGTIQLSLFCTYSDASTDTTCTGAGGTVTWFTENPNALTVNSSGLATGAGAPAWVSTTTYSSGQIVTSGGAIWTALQFTTNETPGSGGSWLRGVGTSIGAYNGAISAHAGIAVSHDALTCVNIRPETTASNITLGSIILLSAEDCSSGDNVGGAAIGNYPAWTSSNTGVATVNNIGEVTATGVGSASITATYVGIAQSRTVTVTNPTILGTTWFVRADGGTVKDVNVPGGQCDGTLNVALAGSTGGHCAVNEIMYCFTDETSSSAYTGIVQGGDTCQVAAPPAGTFYHVAQKSPGTAWVTAALAPGAIAPPSGKPGSPTKLIGAGFATCESADPLHLGSCIPTVSYGAVTIELYDVQNFDVKGIDFWSGVDCIRSASPLFFNCPSGAGAREAIFVDQFTNNFTIENSRIHGYFASIAGTPGPGTVWTNVAVLYNTLTGINFDNPFGYNGNRSDGFSLVNSYIGYAGFAEELPKSLAGGSVNRDGSGHLNVTFPSGSLVNYVPGTNFVVTGNTPSDLNGTFPVTSVNFNQNTANITAVSFRGCNDGFNSVGCADFSTTAAPTFNVGDLVKLTTTSPIPSVLNGPFEVMSINTSPVGFTVAGSIFTRPGWLISGSFTGTGTASTALSLVATAAGSSESASVLGTASHVIPAHRAMDQADDTHFSNGDCVGTGNNTIGNWISIGNQFHRCTQDGWDMLHSAMISSIFTGNYVEGVEGQALKLGDADSAVVKNNFIVSTAGANMAPDSNLPPEYNQYLTTFFRAGDAFLTHNEAFDSMIFTNNTVLNVGQNVTWDDQCDSVIGCQSLPFAQFVFQNNDVIAASDTNNPVFNSSQPTIYFQGQNAPIFTTPAWNPNNNLAFQGRNPPGGIGTGNNWALGTCPTIACVANITTFAGEIASLQANWNMNLIAGSPAIGAGVNNSFTPATDFNGTTTTVPSVVGAVNLTGTVTPTAQFFGSGKFFGQQTIP